MQKRLAELESEPNRVDVETILRSDLRRTFTVDIETDSTIVADQQAERARRPDRDDGGGRPRLADPPADAAPPRPSARDGADRGLVEPPESRCAFLDLGADGFECAQDRLALRGGAPQRLDGLVEAGQRLGCLFLGDALAQGLGEPGAAVGDGPLVALAELAELVEGVALSVSQTHPPEKEYLGSRPVRKW